MIPPTEPALPRYLVEQLLEAIQPIPVEPTRLERIGKRLMNAVRAARNHPAEVTAVQEGWQLRTFGLTRKPLGVADGFASWLLRIDAGAELPVSDCHALEELLVLEGSLFLDSRRLEAGDHFRVGSEPPTRSPAVSATGCLLFIRSRE